MNYEKKAEELKKEFEKNSIEFENKVRELQKETMIFCSAFNDQINVINPERHAMRDEIIDLYEFLVLFGDAGAALSPFDFITEKSRSENIAGVVENSINEIPQIEKSHENEISLVATAGNTLAATAMMSSIPAIAFMPGLSLVAIPAVGVATKLYQTFHGNVKKEDFENFEMAIQKAKFERTAKIKELEQRNATMKDAVEIANIYRATIVTVRDSIKRRIIPELKSVLAFLYADAVASSVIAGELDKEEIKLPGIIEFKGTNYHELYQFVRNTFDYYLMLMTFFKKSILTSILEDGVITPEEKRNFKKQVEAIEIKQRQLTSTEIA